MLFHLSHFSLSLGCKSVRHLVAHSELYDRHQGCQHSYQRLLLLIPYSMGAKTTKAVYAMDAKAIYKQYRYHLTLHTILN